MTWNEIGWVLIALAAVMLLVYSALFKKGTRYRVRTQSSAKAWIEGRARALERGEQRMVLLGDQFWSRAYPGLELQALSLLTSLKRVDAAVDQDQLIAAGTGELALFARQIVQGSYQDGFSSDLAVALPGPTPASFLAGMLVEMGQSQTGSLGLFGIYGAGGVLLSEAALSHRAHPFAAAGSLTAQAALYLNTPDLLLGEEVFLLPGLLNPAPAYKAGWLSEDVLRVILCAVLLVAAILKLVGWL